MLKRIAAVILLWLCGGSAGYALDSVTLEPRVIQVGKWAEGIVYDGHSLWVAESGQQSIAQIDLGKGAVARHVKVGRLPVEMVLGKDGDVYALVETDKLIWHQFTTEAGGRPISGLAGCPNGLAVDDKYLWVLTWPDCSSDTGRLIRLGQGGRATSGMLDEMAQSVIAHQGKVWVAHSRGRALSIVDAQSLSIQKADIQGAALKALTGNGANVYAGGQLASGQGVVALVDSSTFKEVRRQVVDQPIAVIVDDSKNVVAVGEKGKVFVFSTGLELERTINLTTSPLDPKAVILVGDTLYISNGQQFGENGAVLIVSSWRPAAIPPRQPGAAPASAAVPGPAVPTAAVPSGAVPSAATPSAAATPSSPSAISATDCPYAVVNLAASAELWMYEDPDTDAPKVIAFPPGAKGLVADRCIRDWCHMTFRGATGWVDRSRIQARCK